jgi:hypothetical protein
MPRNTESAIHRKSRLFDKRVTTVRECASKPTLGAMSRADCPVCGPNTLFVSDACVHCGKAEPAPSKTRIPRAVKRNAEIEATRASRRKSLVTPIPREGHGEGIARA